MTVGVVGSFFSSVIFYSQAYLEQVAPNVWGYIKLDYEADGKSRGMKEFQFISGATDAGLKVMAR